MCVLERYIYTFFIIWLECISNHLEEVGSFFVCFFVKAGHGYW